MSDSSSRVLIIDDDTNLLAGLQRVLGKRFDIVFATGGQNALDMIADGNTFAVVLCDMRMPGMDGIETLERITKVAPNTIRMMLTGNADQKTVVDAVNRGHIYRFYNKPCSLTDLSAGIEAGIDEFHKKADSSTLPEVAVQNPESIQGPHSPLRNRFLLRLVSAKISHLCQPPHSLPRCLYNAVDVYLQKVFGDIVYEELNEEAGTVLSEINCADDLDIWPTINKKRQSRRFADTILVKILLHFENFNAGKRTFLININQVAMHESSVTFDDSVFTLVFSALFSQLREDIKDNEARVRLDFLFGNDISARLDKILNQGLKT